MWPFIFAAALASSLFSAQANSTPLLLVEVLFNGATSVLEPLVAAWLIWRVAGEEFAERAAPFVLAMLVAVPVAAFAMAVPLVLGELSTGLVTARAELGFLAAWYSAAIADLMGMLVLTPPISIWARQPAVRPRPARALEMLLFAAAVAVVFATPEAAQARYLLVAIHLAIALRFPLKWAAAAIALTSLAYLALAAVELRDQPAPEMYALFLNNIAFVTILNLAAYVTALLHLETRNRAVQLGELANHLGEAEERERERIAQVLHGDLQQLLVVAKMALRPRSDEAGDRARARIDEAIEVARTLTTELHPHALSDRDLATVLEWLAWQMRELTGLEVRVEADPSAEPDSPGMRAFLFQAVRELLMNVVKHAGTDVAWVRLRRADGWLHAEVEDRGKGCDPQHFEVLSREGRRHGASTLKQRIGLLGGRFDMASDRGCRITLSVPVAR